MNYVRYFEISGYFIKYLLVLSIFSVPIYLIHIIAESPESATVEFMYTMNFTKWNVQTGIDVIYTFVICVWSFIFVTKWSNHEYKLAYLWGQLDYEMSENKLQTYKGEERRSPIDDDLHELYYPSWLRMLKMAFSGLISAIIICALALAVGGLLFFRNWIIETEWSIGIISYEYAIILPAILNTIQIAIFTAIYNFASIKLTAFENQETSTKYEDSLIIKSL